MEILKTPEPPSPKARQYRTPTAENPELPPPQFSLWGKDENLKFIWKQIKIATRFDVPLLVVGESGTGKEVLAREIWKARREARGLSLADAPLIAINSAAIPPDIAESILFGHERGAFTSARERQFGRFEMARRGSLFLDEIQCLDLGTQSKLLRCLEQKTFEPLGSRESKLLECQMLFATNIPLEILVTQGRFRKDLFYRLSLLQIYLPPLRDQKELIPQLCEKMLIKISSAHRIGRKVRLSPAVACRLQSHNWPGNFRELEHVLLYALLQSTSEVLEESDLPLSLQQGWTQKMAEGVWS